jgi:hypothetical protein
MPGFAWAFACGDPREKSPKIFILHGYLAVQHRAFSQIPIHSAPKPYPH